MAPIPFIPLMGNAELSVPVFINLFKVIEDNDKDDDGTEDVDVELILLTIMLESYKLFLL